MPRSLSDKVDITVVCETGPYFKKLNCAMPISKAGLEFCANILLSLAFWFKK